MSEWEKYRRQAKDPDKFNYMLGMLTLFESRIELERAAMTYILDKEYSRPDISLVLKAIKTERDW